MQTNSTVEVRRIEDRSAMAAFKDEGFSLDEIVEEMASNGHFTSKATIWRSENGGKPEFVPGLKKAQIHHSYFTETEIAARLLVVEHDLRVTDAADRSALNRQLIIADAALRREKRLLDLLGTTSYSGRALDLAAYETLVGQVHTYRGEFAQALERTNNSIALLNDLDGMQRCDHLLMARNVLNTFYQAFRLDHAQGDEFLPRTYTVALSYGRLFYKTVKEVAQWSSDPRLPYWAAEMAVMAKQLEHARELLEASAAIAGYEGSISDWLPFWEQQPVKANPWLSVIIVK